MPHVNFRKMSIVLYIERGSFFQIELNTKVSDEQIRNFHDFNDFFVVPLNWFFFLELPCLVGMVLVILEALLTLTSVSEKFKIFKIIDSRKSGET